MKYLKKFELNINIPEIGDYIIMDCNNSIGNKFNAIFYFLNNNIGKVVGYGNAYGGKGIKIKYFNIPKNLNSNFNPDHIKIFSIDDVLSFGKNKDVVEEDSKIKRNAKKFNI